MKPLRRDVLWPALEALGSGLFSVAGAFAIARLIGPAELGIGAAAVAVHVLLWVAVNALFADAIVQRPNFSETALSSAAWASTAVGCAAALVQAGSGFLLAWLLDDPRLLPMALLLAVPLPFVGMGGALQGLLTRERRFRTLAIRALTGQGAGMALGIVLAIRGHGAWAPVAQQTAASAIAAMVLIGAAGWRPRAVFRWDDIRDLLRIGLPLTASTLVQIGRYRLFALLIGGTAGATALGHIHMAFRLADTARDIVFTALWRLFLPVLSRQQHDRAALLAQVDRLLGLSSVATLPLCGALAVGLVPLVEWVLGPAWRDAGMAAVPLVGLMALLALMFPSGVALIAVGEARFTLYANLAGLAATLGFAVAARPGSPWEAAMVWYWAQIFVSPFSLWVNGRALGTGPFRPLRAGMPMALVSAAAAALALGPETSGPCETLIWRLGVFGAVVAIGAVLLHWPARPIPGARRASGGAYPVRPYGRTRP